ncbi:MAG TPA: LptE family protein [Gemmataceae bacterium]|nr:LptE family protein [Gemmataceae bacterium]
MSAIAGPPSRRRFRPVAGVLLGALLAAGALALPACEWDGHFTILGYTTRPNYDPCIRTVRVPIFENLTVWRGLEFDLTQAVIREIELRTPYKVVSAESAADTELTGRIISFNKLLLNRNQFNEVREAETTLAVEVSWKDLRTGEYLSRPRPRPPAPGMPAPPPPPPGEQPPPVLVQSIATFIPELGESITTAQKRNVDRLAVQIVSMMELPW